jgi:hypothetical protein
VAFDGGAGVPLNEAAHRVPAERITLWAREYRIVRAACSFCEVAAQHGDAAPRQWRGTGLPALSVADEVSTGSQVDVAPAQPGQFGDTQPGLHRGHEQGMITSADAGGAVGAGQQRVHLGRSQEGHQGAVASLGRDSEDSLNQRGMLRVAQCREPEQRPHRGQPGVPAGHGEPAVALDVIEERGDPRGVQIVNA